MSAFYARLAARRWNCTNVCSTVIGHLSTNGRRVRTFAAKQSQAREQVWWTRWIFGKMFYWLRRERKKNRKNYQKSAESKSIGIPPRILFKWYNTVWSNFSSSFNLNVFSGQEHKRLGIVTHFRFWWLFSISIFSLKFGNDQNYLGQNQLYLLSITLCSYGRTMSWHYNTCARSWHASKNYATVSASQVSEVCKGFVPDRLNMWLRSLWFGAAVVSSG